MNGLSILIPEYNCNCTKLVHNLYLQCVSACLPFWEIIVADDGSKDNEIISKNRSINKFPHCIFIERKSNIGRSAIRNFLASKAIYERLLFIDSDMCIVSNRFILNYMDVTSPIVYGGYYVLGTHERNLRYLYERKSQFGNRASERNKKCNLNFHTSNYCIDRHIQLTYPLDTAYHGYGYEDIAYGAKLSKIGLNIFHVDNPVGFYDFESNESYLQKVEESLYNLYIHREQLQGYSRIISFANIIKCVYLHHVVRWIFILMRRKMREILITNPKLFIFSLYKIGFYINVIHSQERE